MAVSSSYDYSVTGGDIARASLRAVNAVAAGETVAAEDLADTLQALNLLIKAWQARGIGIWLNQEVTLFLQADTISYSIGPSGTHCSASVVKTELGAAAAAAATNLTVDSITGITDGDYLGIELDAGTVQWTTVNGTPSGTTVVATTGLTSAAAIDNHIYTYTTKTQRPLEVLEAKLRDSSDNDRPLRLLAANQYANLSVKTSEGSVNSIYYQPTLTDGTLRTWPECNDVQERIVMTIKRPVMDIDSQTDDFDFPKEWFRALKWNLAVEIWPEFRSGVKLDATIAALAVSSLFDTQGFDKDQGSVFIKAKSR